MPSVGDKDVLRFDVSMGDTLAVEEFKDGNNLGDIELNVRQCQVFYGMSKKTNTLVEFDELREVSAFQVLHYKIQFLARLECAIKMHCPRMLEIE
jgi:hypothetical protein